MRAIVIQSFIDSQSGNGFNSGDIVEFADDRTRFLAERGYVNVVEVAQTPEVEKAVEKRAFVKKAEPKKAVAKTTRKKQG